MALVWVVYAQLNRSPSEVMRYFERRLEGHPKLEYLVAPLIQAIRTHIERPVDLLALPSFSKGQRSSPLPPQQYDGEGKPIAALSDLTKPRQDAPTRLISSTSELQSAVLNAHAGDILEILPGTYQLDSDLKTGAGGTANRPVILRSAAPGQVVLKLRSTEGIRISHPYWIVENLTLQGRCGEDRYCEHAFHIYGPARNTVIRNNLLEDFNAQIKVNGLHEAWPDGGLIQYNTIRNSRRRNTNLPVTPIDIVGANGWVIADNIISDFVKGSGNGISYGAFMKGGGSDGRIERNLVVCTSQDISQQGVRVGLSLGGGGTGTAYCRDQRCETEHTRGWIVNNVIANCNDSGIDVNTSNQSVIANNTLINTSGIVVRQPTASAYVYGNLLDGSISARNDALLTMDSNLIANTRGIFENPDSLHLDWKDKPMAIATHIGIVDDFCKHPRSKNSPPGAFDAIRDCQQ